MLKHITISFLSILIGLSLHAQKWPGHVFFHTGTTNSTVKMVDTAGNTEKSWTVTGGPGYSTYLMPGNKICKTTRTTTSITGGGVHGKCQIVNWDGTLAWDFTYSTANEVIHHDHCPLPNGNILFICYDQITATECAALGRTAAGNVKFEKIIEVKPTGLNTGTVVWEWRLRDHLVQTSDATKPNYTTTPQNRPERFNINYTTGNITTDPFHMNGIDYDPVLDQIVFSCHFLNEWFIIDHSTTTAEAATSAGGITGRGGDFLYRWGKPTNYNAAGTTNFNVLHDAHWVKRGVNRAGSVVAINNGGQTTPTTKSTIDWAKPSMTGFLYNYTVGTALPPTTYDKRLITAGYTSNMGNSEQYPNGNTMVCIATAGTIYEYDSNANLLWTYATGGSTAQAHKYNDCDIDSNSIRAAVDTYTVSKCSADLSPVYVSVTPSKGTGTNTYQWSSYPAGTTGNTQAIQVNPTTTTSYTVTVTSGSCTATATKMVRVITTPTANAGNDTTINFGQSATLNGNGTGSYLWTPGNFTTKSITVSPTTKTTYVLRVSNGNCVAYDTVVVDVFTGPLTVNPTAKDTMVCIGDSVTINAGALGGNGMYTYTWSSIPAGFTGSSDKLKISLSSTTLFKVVVSDGTKTDSGTITITANNKPVINAGNDTFIYSGQSITLNGTGTGSYLWTPGGATTKSTTVSPTTKTSYIFKVYLGSCASYDTVVVDVYAGPLTVKPTAKDTIVCEGDFITIYSGATGGKGNNTYSWSSIPAGFTGNADSIKIKILTTTNFRVIVSDGTKTDTGTINITVNTKPNINAGNDTFVVSGQSVILKATGGTSYNWNIGNTTDTITVAPTCKTTYVVISSSNNCSDTDEVSVSIIPKNVIGKKIKFAVDMRGYALNPNGIHIFGDFQTDAGFEGGNWNACSIELFRESADTNIYSRVLTLPAFKKYEFKFVNGVQDYEQEFVPEESRVGYNFVDSRWIYLDSLQNDTTIIGAIMFERNAPLKKKLIRYKVNMAGESSVSSNRVHVGTSYQSFSPTATVLYSFIPKIYEIISYVDSGTYEFKYINGNQTSNAETITGTCTSNGNRKITTLKDTVLPAVCYTSCDTCKKTTGLGSLQTIDMRVMPNPVTSSAVIHFDQFITGNIVLINQMGEVVMQEKVDVKNEIPIYRNQLAAGIYYLQVHAEDSPIKTIKVIFE